MRLAAALLRISTVHATSSCPGRDAACSWRCEASSGTPLRRTGTYSCRERDGSRFCSASFRGACHRAALRADPLAHAALRPGHVPPHSRGAMRPSAACIFVPRKTEGAGNAGCPSHPQPRMQNKKAYERRHHRFAGFTQHSLRNGFNGFLRALLGDRAFLPPSFSREWLPRKLDASVGASGPHDFAVRISATRQARSHVHRIPFPTSVTIAIRPSFGDGTAADVEVIWVKNEQEYFCERGWTGKSTDSLSGKSRRHQWCRFCRAQLREQTLLLISTSEISEASQAASESIPAALA